MIKDSDVKKDKIIQTIVSRIDDINHKYRKGPSLYFYKRLNSLRNNSADIGYFVKPIYNIEIIYATLATWNMDSRGAKMKEFNKFKDNIKTCLPLFKSIEKYHNSINPYSEPEKVIELIERAYKKINLMESNGKLVSASKLLHFLFPKLFVPIDRSNTLMYFYGNTSESLKRFIEINKLCYELIKNNPRWEVYLDDNWNTSLPKLIDNAIILLRNGEKHKIDKAANQSSHRKKKNSSSKSF